MDTNTNLQVKEAMRKSVSTRAKEQNSLSGMTQGDIASYLAPMKSRLAAVLPKHLTAERIIQMAATTIARNPNIAKCTPASLLGSVMQASVLGFPPVDALGYCYFVPYGNQVQFQIGYRGMIELARRSGRVKMIYAEVVREGDDFKCEYGLEPKLTHKPKLDPSKPMTHVYAVCHFADGGCNFVVLSRQEVERLRMRNQMQAKGVKGAWLTDYEAMAKAKALKQLSKYLPLNIDTMSAIQSDEAVITPDNFSKDGAYKIEDAVYEPVREAEEMAAAPATESGNSADGVMNVDETTGEILSE